MQPINGPNGAADKLVFSCDRNHLYMARTNLYTLQGCKAKLMFASYMGNPEDRKSGFSDYAS
jgi:hypothetical protein